MDRLPAVLRRRIRYKIISLKENPRPRGIRKLSSREEYRLRVGDYRILYDIYDKEKKVVVLAVGHRRDVYS
jgi:mRNA interferase RelE/StbE